MATTYAQIARKMPYSIEAEQSVLGCILISSSVADELCSKLAAESPISQQALRNSSYMVCST